MGTPAAVALLTALAGPDGHAPGGRLADLRVLPGRPARTVELPEDCPELLAGRLRLVGVHRLYAHQAAVWQHVRAGRHVVVATGTASGKTLCWQLPVVERILADPDATALYVAPTKALGRDQVRQLRALRLPQIRTAVYDGDTPPADRRAVQATANVLVTNPDMLHVGILPRHRDWGRLLRGLSVVVIDECHVARGVFGAHVAAVLRRLLRLCDLHGATPTVVAASATIAEPAAHVTTLTGLPVQEVSEDASPRPARTLAVWSPPLLDVITGTRRSMLTETAELLAGLVRAGRATIAFVRSRAAAEIVAVAARRSLDGAAGHPGVLAYRAGLLADERRRVERALVDGSLRGVAATDALELGIDVGALDAVVIGGWPGTVASLWQQAGRAGRRADADAVVVFVADDDPLDRWLVAHPGELVGRPLERTVTDATNPHVLADHLVCAAAESPLDADEPWFAPADVGPLVRELVAAGRLRERGGRAHAAARSPAAAVGLRSIGGPPVRIVEADGGRLVGDVDAARAQAVVHPGAVYLHQGTSWQVVDLDERRGVAHVAPDASGDTTTARTTTDLRITATRRSRSWGRCRLERGTVQVTTTVVGFTRRRPGTGELVADVELDLAPRTLVTTGVWLVVPDAVAAAVPLHHLGGAVHAAEHTAIGLIGLLARCDRWDVGGVSSPRHPDTGAATIVIHDAHPGGVGLAERVHDADDRLWRAAWETIVGCPCDAGCPSCVQSPKCGNGNTPLSKAGARALLAAVLAERDVARLSAALDGD